MRALVAVLIVVLAAAPAFALKASHHRYKRDAAKNATITNVETAGGRRAIRTTSRSIEDREHLPGMR